MKLSPQKQIIVDKLRSMDWVCSSEFGYIKDDRKRISELNAGYMKEKGYEIIGKRCDGRCGKTHSSTLFMRKAVKIEDNTTRIQVTIAGNGMTPETFIGDMSEQEAEALFQAI